MTIHDENWTRFLGCSITDPDLFQFLASIGISEFNDTSKYNYLKSGNGETFNYNSHGLSLYFIESKLDSVDFYSKSKKFHTVDAKVLPYGIELGHTGKDLVEKFGEPLEKGGGMPSKLDIWLRWERLQVDIDEKSWDKAKDAVWSSVTIF